MFCEEKVAQMAAYLLLKRGGRMAYLKLMKLLYLSNRKSILKHGRMIGEDSLYSMKFGPVMSNTLNLIRGKAEGIGDYWYNLIETNGHDVLLRSDPREIDEIYSLYGHMNRFDLANMTHLESVCPEWHNPGNSRKPIDLKEMLISEGKSEDEANRIIGKMEESQKLKEFSLQLS